MSTLLFLCVQVLPRVHNPPECATRDPSQHKSVPQRNPNFIRHVVSSYDEMGSLARTYFARLPNLGSFFTNPRPRNTPETERLKYTKNYFRVVEQFSLLSVSPIREEQWPLLNLKQSAPHCRRSAVSLWTIFVSFCSIWAPHFLLSIVECWKLYQNGAEEQVEAHLLRNRSGLHAVPRAISIKSCKSISMPILAIPESRTLPIQAFQTTSRETLFK